MPASPATPNKTDKSAVKSSPVSAIPSVEKHSSVQKIKFMTFSEPSPASTYGETALSNFSTPATATTPDVGSVLKDVKVLKDGVQNLANAIEKLSVSSTEDRDSIRAATGDVHSSPSDPRGATITRHDASTTSSPSSTRERSMGDSQWGAVQSNFVYNSRKANDVDDVFTSTDNARLAMHPVSDQSGNEPPYNPREDRAGEVISNENAQALLPPSACVFVANLTQSQTDDQLQDLVCEAFIQYGMCYVKIKRDLNGMPFAFVQYNTVDVAQRAITQGRGMLINGRPCRTEVAKVNRSLHLSKTTGGHISEAEARNVLSRYGDIQKVWHCSQTENEIFRLPEGIWIMFAFFQDCRDAQAGFRDHPQYRLEQAPMVDDFRARLRSRQHHSVSPMRSRLSPGRTLASPLRRVATDLCSIFVGNLPATISQEQLFHMFDKYGPIQNIEIVRKQSAHIFGINAFAFIEYLSAENAIAAMQASPRMYGNIRLRVERKESVDPAMRSNTFTPSSGSPRGPYLADSHDHMAMLYQRGVYAGITQAAQAQAIPPPVWAPFQYYQSFDPSQYGSFSVPAAPACDNPAVVQAQGISHTNHTAGQSQYPQVPPSCVQYPQQPAHASYQWPPANIGSETVQGSPAMSPQDDH